MAENSIGINIWDDYYDDGYVPNGEIQETYAYVESSKMKGKDEDCKNILDSFKKTLEELAKPEWALEFDLHYHDSTKIYPNLVGTEHEWCLYKRWQLGIKHLTHEAREYFVEALKNKQLEYNGMQIDVYSES